MNRNQYNTFQKDLERNVIVPFRQTRLANLQALQLHDALQRYYSCLSITTSTGLVSELILAAVNFSLSTAEKTVMNDLRQHVVAHLSKSRLKNNENQQQELVSLAYEEVWRKDDLFKQACNEKLNELTQQFFAEFMTAANQIDWLKLIDFVSKREGSKVPSSSKNNSF